MTQRKEHYFISSLLLTISLVGGRTSACVLFSCLFEDGLFFQPSISNLETESFWKQKDTPGSSSIGVQ